MTLIVLQRNGTTECRFTNTLKFLLLDVIMDDNRVPSLQISKFSPKTIADKIRGESSPVICVIGKRNTGKSLIIQSLLYANRHIPTGVIICPTETGNAFYAQFVPDSFIHHEFDPDILSRIMHRQRSRVKKFGKRPENDFIIVLDDCMYNSREICNNLHIKEIFRNGRHFQITIIVAAQYVMDLPIPLRSNIDLVFCMRENNVQNVERLYKQFFGIFPSKQFFAQAFNTITENYGSIVVDTLSRSNKIDECVFWYRAPYPCQSFRLGSANLWRFHDRHYDESYMDGEEEDGSKKKNDSLRISQVG